MFYGECINGCGGLVGKVERGEYRVTGKAVFMLWEPIEYYEEDVKADIERRKATQEDLGITEEEFQEAVMEELVNFKTS